MKFPFGATLSPDVSLSINNEFAIDVRKKQNDRILPRMKSKCQRVQGVLPLGEREEYQAFALSQNDSLIEKNGWFMRMIFRKSAK